ncbi:hypothetical protein C8R43DRAFT_280885 [Mycena crocata]|nr:hypothetical protein C8R43DRAFT_280885 [Mycena crocata]
MFQSFPPAFPLTPSQAFFVLGKDGSQYRALSSKYSVHMEYLRNPLSLRVEGQIGSLKKLSKHIVELKAALVEDVFELPIDKPIRVDLLKRISQLSGAFTENFGPGKVRIVFSSNNPRTALVAQRLATRAVCEGNDDTRLFLHLPPSVPSSSPLPPSAIFPHSYSLYPFLSPRSLPWTVSAGGVFRLRRVEDWLSTGASEDLQKTGGLLMGRGRTVTQQQQDVDLRTLLEENSPESSSSTSRVLTASIGHILVTTPSSNQITILPPLAGHHKLPHILEWIEKQTEPTLFTPTLPTALLSLQPNHHRMLHRLIYRALQSANDAPKTIRMELDIPRSVPANEDAGLAEPVLRPRCWVGKNIDLDVMMPDRPADIRFSIFDSVYLSPQEMPSTLEEYATDLQAFLSYQDRDASQPETPLTVVHEGLTYILLSSSTVRQNMEEDTGASRPVRVVTESILDLEGDQKSASCQVICEDVVTDAAWKSFMGHCDVMSTMQATTTRTAL